MSNDSLSHSGFLSTVAIRVHHLEQMVEFYSRAFGAQFQQVDVHGIQCQFGTVKGVTLKLVPIRDGTDFVGFPIHQLGFTVSDVDGLIALTVNCGGKQEGPVIRNAAGVHAAVRDPDGNTIELSSQPGQD